MSDRVSISIDQGVADVRLVRADKMNALDPAMSNAIVDAGIRLKSEPGLRAVVISGEGRAFCAGLDFGNFAKMGAADPEKKPTISSDPLGRRTHGISNLMQYVAYVWREVPVPVIAAVHGVAFGGGFQLALGADIRIVAPDTRMSIMEIKWGLIPDMSGIALMRGLVRDDVVRELTYTGRIFSGEEAQSLGFATKVSTTPYEDALSMAREIAGKSPDAVRAGKRLFNAMADQDAPTLLQQETDEQIALIGGANQVEAVLSNLQKRAANYRD
jgi:enoyl-CoA hydratase/carnithine racemase